MTPVLNYSQYVLLLICLHIVPVYAADIVTLQEEPARHLQNASFRHGINFAGDFEVIPRGAWGAPIKREYFDLAAQAGFDHVRIPVRWSSHTGAQPDYKIHPAFFEEVDWLLDEAERAGLSVIINTHHFEELNSEPEHNRAKLLAIWKQVAWRYRNRPHTLAFELNNEPTFVFDEQPALWNNIAEDALQIVRDSNPDRLVIIGPVGYNHPNRLHELTLPDDDNLMATVHVYDPGLFTLQGAPWMTPPPPTGAYWDPLQLTSSNGWQFASWDSTVNPTREGIDIEFHRQYAAFALKRESHHLTQDELDRSLLVVEATADLSVIALCNVWTDVKSSDFLVTQKSTKNHHRLTADLSACGPIYSIALQSDSHQSGAAVILSVRLCNKKDKPQHSCESLLTTQTNFHAQVMHKAGMWAAQHQVPMYLGEFGVYDPPDSPVDQASKLAWIRSLRHAAEYYGIGWAFFEFGNEFGVYNRRKNSLNQAMLDALLR